MSNAVTQIRHGGWQSSLNGDYWLTVEDRMGISVFWIESVTGGYIPWILSSMGKETVTGESTAIPLSKAIFECEDWLYCWKKLDEEEAMGA